MILLGTLEAFKNVIFHLFSHQIFVYLACARNCFIHQRYKNKDKDFLFDTFLFSQAPALFCFTDMEPLMVMLSYL